MRWLCFLEIRRQQTVDKRLAICQMYGTLRPLGEWCLMLFDSVVSIRSKRRRIASKEWLEEVSLNAVRHAVGKS
jgi:hypothetical protein